MGCHKETMIVRFAKEEIEKQSHEDIGYLKYVGVVGLPEKGRTWDGPTQGPGRNVTGTGEIFLAAALE